MIESLDKCTSINTSDNGAIECNETSRLLINDVNVAHNGIRICKLHLKHVVFVLLIITAAAERVIMKVMTDRMANFTFFLAELIAFLYIPVFFSIVLFKFKMTKDITSSMTSYPKRKFFIMAIFDTIASMLVLIPSAHISGDLITLILQGVIPVTMVCSLTVLRKRYKWSHYVGSFVILGGITLDLVPKAIQNKDSIDSNDLFLYGSLLFISALPMAGGAIYREIALKTELDVYYLNAWVSLFQLFIGLPLAPALFLLQNTHIHLNMFWTNIDEGFKCFLFGETPSSPEFANCKCHNVGFIVLLYITVNVAFNVLFTKVVQYGSALMMFIALAVAVPISYFLFAWDVVQPHNPLNITVWGILGLCVTLIGLAIYYYFPEPEESPQNQDDVEKVPELSSNNNGFIHGD